MNLSKPEEIWNTVEILLEKLRSRINQIIQKINQKGDDDVQNKLKVFLNFRTFDDKEVDFMNPFPVFLTIIGTKYDLFQVKYFFILVQLENCENKMMVLKILRFLSHYYAASLYVCFY